MEIEIGNSAKVVTGHVLDCSHDLIKRKFRDMDERLYFKWNPESRLPNQPVKGRWEIRMRPTHRVGIYQGEVDGIKLFKLGYKENDFENLVKSFDYLDLRIVDWLEKHDTFKHKNWQDDIEYSYDKYREKYESAQRDELLYQLRHERKHMKKLQEELLSDIARFSKAMGS